MVEIVLTARTPEGEQAIRKYHDEKVGFMVRAQMRSRQITGERRIVSDNPLVHVSTINVQGADKGAVAQRFKVIQEQLELLYEKKMLDYGASAEDYDIQVNHD